MMQLLYDRMPVILDAAGCAGWLDPNANPQELQALLRPFPSEDMKATPVSTWVSSPRNEDARCVEPVDAPNAPPPSRLAAGLTRNELASRAGVHAAQITNLELGHSTKPFRATLRRLCRVLGSGLANGVAV